MRNITMEEFRILEKESKKFNMLDKWMRQYKKEENKVWMKKAVKKARKSKYQIFKFVRYQLRNLHDREKAERVSSIRKN